MIWERAHKLIDLLIYRPTRLDIDIWLGAHPGQNDTFGKLERLMKGESPNPFIDPDGWKRFIANLQSSFQKLLSA